MDSALTSLLDEFLDFEVLERKKILRDPDFQRIESCMFDQPRMRIPLGAPRLGRWRKPAAITSVAINFDEVAQ